MRYQIFVFIEKTIRIYSIVKVLNFSMSFQPRQAPMVRQQQYPNPPMQQGVPIQNGPFQPNYFGPYSKAINPGGYENSFQAPRYSKFSFQREMLDLKKLIESAAHLKENDGDESPYCARWSRVTGPFPSIWKFGSNDFTCTTQQTVVIEETIPAPQPVVPNFLPQKNVSEYRPSPSPPNQYQFQPQRQPRTAFNPQAIDPAAHTEVSKPPPMYGAGRSESPEYNDGPRSRRGQKPQRKNRTKRNVGGNNQWTYRSDQ